MILRECLDTPLDWTRRGTAEFPYAASVAGQNWVIRVNDFPAEALYTLLVDGRELGDFDDWPPVWRRPDPA